MSQISTGILGGLAVVLTLGAVQLASGRDLVATQSADISSAVNRAAKADRDTVQLPQLGSRTVSIRLEGVPDTSVLIRLPQNQRLEANDLTKSTIRPAPAVQVKRAIACEPVVSVLTEVAKQLQPGRCVT